jgi:hypothetical protein
VPGAFEGTPTPGGGPLLLWVPKAEPDRCKSINAGGSIDDVAARIRAALC